MKKLILSVFAGLLITTITQAQQYIQLDRDSWPYIYFSENGTGVARIQGAGGMFAVTSLNGGTRHFTVNSTTSESVQVIACRPLGCILEELALYVIEQNKRIEAYHEENEAIKKQLGQLRK